MLSTIRVDVLLHFVAEHEIVRATFVYHAKLSNTDAATVPVSDLPVFSFYACLVSFTRNGHCRAGKEHI